MKGDILPGSDHILRYCGGLHVTEQGRISGTAFRLKATEVSLSVNWLEILKLPDRAAQVKEIRRVLNLQFGARAKLAVLSNSSRP
jgi:hypothetical protein